MPDSDLLHPTRSHAIAYGCSWQSDLPLSSFDRGPLDGPSIHPDSTIRVQHVLGPPARSLMQEGQHLWRGEDGLRYVAQHGTIYDTFTGDRILVSGPIPEGDLPLPFYGTVASLVLAWRGLIPIHGSAVSWNGRALLLCGPAGTGKSTLAAALISRGATLLSDDLSLLHSVDPGQPLHIFPGRTSIRLFPSTAAALAQSVSWQEPPRRADHKLAVFPPRLDPRMSLPLHGLILPGAQHPAGAAEALAGQIFRPKAMLAVPGQRWRLSALAFAARHLTVLAFPAGPVRTSDDFERAADRLVFALTTAGL